MNSIGTLSEKSVHAELKDMIADKRYQEIKVLNYICDVVIDNEIYEVQTSKFKTISNKIRNLLERTDYNITVLMPVYRKNKIIFYENNEIVRESRTRHKGVLIDRIDELESLKEFIGHKRFKINFIELDTIDIRLSGGRANHGTKQDKQIEKVLNTYLIENSCDLNCFVSMYDIGETFTVADIKKYTKTNAKYLHNGLKILKEMKVIDLIGKKGNAFVFKRLV